jgi:hypothetical protein
MALPVNIDSTYTDRTNPGDKIHQQHHDALHTLYNEIETAGGVPALVGGGGGGVSDHGALTGLTDDDHTQYHTDARGDARYQQLDAGLTSFVGLSSAADKIAYATGIDTWALTDFTSAARGLLDDADVSAMRTTLELALVSQAEAEAGAATGTRSWSSLRVRQAADAAVAAWVGVAPGALNTLDELAAALGDDPNFASTITTALASKQAQDTDLDTIAALTPSNDDFLQRKAGAWANRTIAQVKTDLSLDAAVLTSMIGVYSGTGTPVRPRAVNSSLGGRCLWLCLTSTLPGFVTTGTGGRPSSAVMDPGDICLVIG